MDKNNLKLYQQLIIDIVGITANLAIVLFLKILNNSKLNYLIYYNILMIIFNVFPIIPLDGYQICNDILNIIYEEEYSLHVVKIISGLSLIIMLVLIFLFKLYGLLVVWSFLLIRLLLTRKDSLLIKKYLNLYKMS